MGNQYTKPEDAQATPQITVSSNDIHDNIKKAFNLENDKNNHTLDSIGWYNKQNRGANYVNPSTQRYEQFKNVSKNQTYANNKSYTNSKLNAINENSDMFLDTPKNTFIPKKNNNSMKNQSSEGEITEIKQLREMINSKFKDNRDSTTSIFDNISSPNGDINKLKNMINAQMGGGCGCSGDYFISPMKNDINLSVLKGGAKQEYSRSDESNELNNLDGSNNSVESYDYKKQSQSNSYDKSISSINHIDEYEDEGFGYDSDENSDKIEDTTEHTENDTDTSVSTKGQIINVAPFYSTETMNASTYFKHLNKNK